MSIDEPRRQFRPDAQEIEVARSALASALTHIEQGYPVVPVVYDNKGAKMPPRKGMREGTTSPTQASAWWKSYPDAQVGIVLDNTRLVVLDVDGPKGEALLDVVTARASATLPGTYEVTTGRGRHLWYRIPVGGRELRSQYGGQHRRPDLDVKMTWLLMVAGSVHPTGARYTANWDHVPALGELPYLPDGVWRQIDAVGRERASGTPRRPAPVLTRASEVTRATPWVGSGQVVDLSGPRGHRVRTLLDDVSDGRDSRVFSALLMMLRSGISPQDAEATLMASPLGGKAREQADPIGWLQHKVEAAERYKEADDRPWDRSAWWSAVVTAGLSDSQVRVLAHLGEWASHSGEVSRSIGLTALNTALSESSARDAINALVGRGWLTILREYDEKTERPRTYDLITPDSAHLPGAVSRATPPLTPDVCPREVSAYAYHDAFRSKGSSGVPSLAGCFQVLALLESSSMSSRALADVLGCSDPTIRRLLARLRDAGLVHTEGSTHHLTTAPTGPLLDRAAATSGTAGIRDLCVERYRERAEERARYKEACKQVGSPEWRRLAVRDARTMLAQPHMSNVVKLHQDAGRTLDQIAEDQAAAYQAHITSGPAIFEAWWSTEEAARLGMGGRRGTASLITSD